MRGSDPSANYADQWQVAAKVSADQWQVPANLSAGHSLNPPPPFTDWGGIEFSKY